MNKTKWIIFTVIVVAIFGGIIWVNKSGEKDYPGDAKKVITEGPIADHTIGSKDNKVVVIEYADFECPGCGHMATPMKEYAQKHPEITFVFREFPLTAIHPNALAAATAAEAAGLQNKYFEMHDMLYQNQNEWAQASVSDRTTLFQNYAQQLGLDVNKFKQDVTNKDVSDKINRDINTGKKQFGFNGTPSFIINGSTITGDDAVKEDIVTAKIDEAIKAAFPNGVPTQQPQTTTTETTQPVTQ